MGVEMTTATSGNEPADPKPSILIPNWQQAHKLFSIQVAVFWGAVQGLYAVWPAFEDSISKLHFIEIGIGMSVLLVLARLTHQPGLD
jgi:hypothetical protein